MTMVCMNRHCQKTWWESGRWEPTCPFCGARCKRKEDAA